LHEPIGMAGLVHAAALRDLTLRAAT